MLSSDVVPCPRSAEERARRKPPKHFPEESVLILQKWLYENRYNPYPTDKQKDTLAEDTKLTQQQIRDWFINARRRILPDLFRREGLDPLKYILKKKRSIIMLRTVFQASNSINKSFSNNNSSMDSNNSSASSTDEGFIDTDADNEGTDNNAASSTSSQISLSSKLKRRKHKQKLLQPVPVSSFKCSVYQSSLASNDDPFNKVFASKDLNKSSQEICASFDTIPMTPPCLPIDSSLSSLYILVDTACDIRDQELQTKSNGD